MTIMTSTSIIPQNLFGKVVELSKDELKEFVESGLIKRVDNHKEHFAIQPCWMQDPGTGVMEEINGRVLGRWNNNLESYVVHVDNVRNNDRSAGMNEDHRWLHIDVVANYYTYTPEVGQQLTGEITKVGNKAAICMLFDVFTATVFANDDTELSSWTTGDVIRFEITSFIHRRKGPILRAQSLVPMVKIEKEFDDGERMDVQAWGMEVEDWETPTLAENSLQLDEKMDTSESSKSKKRKKKKKHIKEEGETADESFNVSSDWQNESTEGKTNDNMVQDSTLEVEEEGGSKKKKKKKKKKSVYNESE